MVKNKLVIDDFLPEYDIMEESAVRVRAPADVIYNAILEYTLAEVSPVVRLLSAMRTIPEKLAGRDMAEWDIHKPCVAQMCADFFTALAEQPDAEIVYGLIVPGDIGRVWKKSSSMDYRPKTAAEYLSFGNLNYLKLCCSIYIEEAGGPSDNFLRAEYRVRALSPRALKRFRPYWRVVGPFSHLIQRLELQAIKKRAENTVNVALATL